MTQAITHSELVSYFRFLHDLMGPVVATHSHGLDTGFDMAFVGPEDERLAYRLSLDDDDVSPTGMTVLLRVLRRLSVEHDYDLDIDFGNDPMVEARRALDTYCRRHAMDLITRRPLVGTDVASIAAAPVAPGLFAFEAAVNGIAATGVAPVERVSTAARTALSARTRRLGELIYGLN